MSGRFRDEWPERSRPIRVQGGVRAKSKRGDFAKNWWGQQFLAALAAMDPYDGPSRLQRGRSYARRGQVLNVDLRPGRVESRVQGSRAAPYRIVIKFQPVQQTAWRRAAQALAEKPAELSALLGGSMTQATAEAFEQCGDPLIPRSKKDIDPDCSCPDWANPCKHVAAVYHLVAEELDRDPLMLLTLRGIDRDGFLAASVGAAGTALEEPSGTGTPVTLPGQAAGREAQPDEAAAFWGVAVAMPTLPAPPAQVDAPLVRGLGEVPFWRGEEGVVPASAGILRRAAGTALEFLTDDGKVADDSPPAQSEA